MYLLTVLFLSSVLLAQAASMPFAEETEVFRVKPPTIDWATDINKTNAVFAQYFKSGNFIAISNLYTEDCSLLPPGEKLEKGRKAAFNIFSSLPGMGVDSVTLTSAEVIPSNNTAVERGVVVLYQSDGSIFDQGKYVVIWKRVHGNPMLYTDIWNSDSNP